MTPCVSPRTATILKHRTAAARAEEENAGKYCADSYPQQSGLFEDPVIADSASAGYPGALAREDVADVADVAVGLAEFGSTWLNLAHCVVG